MIGVLVIAHADLAESFERAAKMILGEEPKGWLNLSIHIDDTPEQIKEKVQRSVNRMRSMSDGLIIFTDVFGGTPSNVTIPFVEEGKVELISGVNLPMLIKVLQERERYSLDELAEKVKQWGKESIHRASEYLKT